MTSADRYSRLRWLNVCRAAYLLYDRAMPASWGKVGTLMHSAIAEYGKRLRASAAYSDGPPPERDVDLARVVAEAYARDLPYGEDHEEFVRMVENVAQEVSMQPPAGWAGIDQERRIVLALGADGAPRGTVAPSIWVRPAMAQEVTEGGAICIGPGHLYAGILDMVAWEKPPTQPTHDGEPSGSVVVWDWKSDRTMHHIAPLHRELQARLYALLASVAFNAAEVHVKWFYARFGITKSWTMDIADLDRAAGELYDLILLGSDLRDNYGVKPDVTLASVGPQCATCDMHAACPAAEAALFHFRHGALQSADEWILLKRTLEDYEEILRERARVAPIPVGDFSELGFHGEDRREIDDARLLKVLRARSWEDEDILEQLATFSVTKVERALKGTGMPKKEVADVMAACVDTKEREKFGLLPREAKK